MPCEDCHKNFTLLRRKRACNECKRIYCISCLIKKSGREEQILCERCIVLTHRPVCATDLSKLKPKDLIFYLQSKHISTAGCVEKDELINLVVIYANNSQYDETTQAEPAEKTCNANPFDQIRQTCTSLFTNITEKITADIQNQFQPPFRAQPAPAPPVRTTEPRRSSSQAGPSGLQPQPQQQQQPTHSSPTAPDSPDSQSSFEEIGAVGGSTTSESGQWQFLSRNASAATSNTTSNGQKHSIDEEENTKKVRNFRRRSDSDLDQNTKKSDIENILKDIDVADKRHKQCDKCNEAVKFRIAAFRLQLEEPNVTEDQNRQRLNDFLVYLETDNRHSVPHSPEERQICDEFADDVQTSANNNNNNEEAHVSTSAPTNSSSSSCHHARTFDRLKRINLGDISAIEDFDQLSVKQLKEILTLNRVDYKGCCEKDELKERVKRLWINHTSNPPDPDQLPSDDLCKICMDAPIECILLECGHLVACLNCSKILSECPVCRQYITRVVRFFRV